MNKPQTQSAMLSHSKNAEQELKRIETLFLRFAAIYGHVWQSLYKNESFLTLAKKEWRIALRPFDNPTLKAALEYCREHTPFPPTLPGFIEQCKNIVKRNAPYVPVIIEGKRTSPEVAKLHLTNIRHLLNMPCKGENQC